MKTQINKELAALMQLDSAEQAIKTLLSSGVAPGTVAAQKVQQTAALTQAAPQSQAAPPGIEALLPGVQQQAAQAAQAAQPATQGDVNQLRQMLAQAQQGQGVAQLPGSDVEMAEGGIVGYNGEVGSAVKLQNPEYDEEGLPRTNEDRQRIERANRSFLEQQRNVDAQKRLQAQQSRVRETSTSVPQQMLDFYRSTGRDVPVTLGMSAPANYYAPPTNQDAVDALVAAAFSQPRQDQPLRGGSPAPRPLASPGERKPPTATATVKPADAGIASLMGPPVPSGSERQFAEALSVLGRTVDPTKRTPEQIAAEREAVYRARGIEPGKAEQERIARLEAFDAQEEAARNKRIEKRGMQDLIQFLSSFGGAASMVEGGRRGTAASTQLQQGWERSDEAYNLLKRQRMDAIAAERVALANRNQALADGDIATAAREAEALRTAQNARLATEAKMRADFAVPMMQAETAAQDRASREREGAEGRKTQLQVAQIGVSKPTAREFDYALFKANPEKYKEFLAAGAEPKSEGAMLKEIVGAVLKNPLMMQQYPPAIQALVNQELLKLGVTPALPKGAPVRE